MQPSRCTITLCTVRASVYSSLVCSPPWVQSVPLCAAPLGYSHSGSAHWKLDDCLQSDHTLAVTRGLGAVQGGRGGGGTHRNCTQDRTFPKTLLFFSLRNVGCRVVALGLNSWGLTQDMLALTESQGGLNLAQPHYFLWWHHSTLFVNYTLHPEDVPSTVSAQFEAWAGPRAIRVTPAQLGWFQMDVNLPWISFPDLAFSAKSFSLLQQGLNVNPPDALSYDMPLWHNVVFKNTHFHTYSSPSLIRDGILTVGQLLEDDSYLNQIAPTWRSVYRETIGQLANQTFVFSEHSR